jgi:hypothetical protein
MQTVWALVCGVSLWLPASAAWGAERESAVGEALLPQEVLVFLSVPSVPELKERLGSSLLGEMMKDTELKPFLDAAQAKIKEASAKMKDESGISLQDLLNLPQGEITFAVMELPPRKLAMVLLLDYGDSEELVDKLLDKLENALKEAGGDVEAEEVDGVTLRTFTFEQERENPFNQLAYFDHDQYLVLASDPEALKAVLERWDGKSDDTLAEQDVFKYIAEKCASEGRDPLFKWYLNPIGLTQSVVGLMQAQVPQAGLVLGFLPILGLDKLKGIGGAGDIGVDDFDSLATTFIYVDQPTTGLMKAFQFPVADLTPPKWVPASAAMYTAMNWNVAGAYSAIETLVDSFQGPGSFSRLIDQWSDNESGPQVHLKKDLIDQLSGQIHLIIGETDDFEDPNPKLLFALDVKNASKMKAVLAKAAKAPGFGGTTREFEGTTIYEMEAEGRGQSASVALADKHLLISTDTPMLEEALRPSGNAPSLVDDPVFRKLASKFPKKVSMLSFQNGNSQLQSIYNMLKGGNLPDMPDEVRDLASKLPNFEVLKRYLRATGGYTIPDKKGAYSATFSLRDEK